MTQTGGGSGEIGKRRRKEGRGGKGSRRDGGREEKREEKVLCHLASALVGHFKSPSNESANWSLRNTGPVTSWNRSISVPCPLEGKEVAEPWVTRGGAGDLPQISNWDSLSLPVLLPNMISRRTGQIVLVNNIQAKFGIPFRTACKSLRQNRGVLAVCLCQSKHL